MNPIRQVQLSNSSFELTAQRAVANDFAGELKTPAREIGASVDQVFKSLERNQSADADDARRG